MFKIWTLNQAATLLEKKNIQKKIIDVIKKSTNENAEFGNRNKYNLSNINQKLSHNLMYEEDFEYNEYFVPIPIKCLGSKLEKNDKKEFKNIIDYHKKIKRKPYKFFWDNNDSNTGKMATKNHIGYYEILEKEAKGNNKIILIGYSQGGLVAKYLGWLDQYVFKKNIIHTIITIASPNYGSPLANMKNKNNIIKIVNRTLHKILYLLNKNKDDVGKFGFRDFQGLTQAFDSLIEFSKAMGLRKLQENFSSFKKWLGGLANHQNNAFFDLNLDNIEKIEGHVLNSVNKYPLNKYCGSIITASNSIFKFILGMIDNIIIDIILILIVYFKGVPHKLSQISRTYSDIMQEQIPDKKNNIIKEKQNQYLNGILDKKIILNKYAHDFVIPSAYQLQQKNNDKFLGNFINCKGDHNSGRSIKERGGKINIKYLKTLLSKISL